MRQFILEKNLEKDGTVTLEGKDFKYLRQVLRVRPGDMISLRLADGSLQNSTVTKIDEKSKRIQLQVCANCGIDDGLGAGGSQSSGGQNSSAKSITRGVQAQEIQAGREKSSDGVAQIEYILLQFVPRPQKFEQIVRQSVECGVKYIVPVFGEYSEKSSIQALSGNVNKKERLERIVKEARQQSGSPVDSVVTEPMTLEQAVEFVHGGKQTAALGESSATQNSTIGFVLSERDEGSVKISEVLAKNPDVKRIAIACGSEGGISPKEVEFLCKKGLFLTVHFSVNILRCETAALYGIAAVQTAV
ncbi:MAG: RNA methyltransferase [Treponema sp.]|nr:RNA methyltransferase [Treponema sp.]